MSVRIIGAESVEFRGQSLMEHVAILMKYKRMEKALRSLEEWVSGYALDHVPNDVYQNTEGRACMERAHQAIYFDPLP